MQGSLVRSIATALVTFAGLLAVTGCVQLQPAEGSLGERLSFYGNARVRHESTFDQTNGADRHRGRLRARVGADYQVTEELRAAARLSTSSGDANNPHWDVGEDGDGEGLNGSSVDLDRLYLTWDASESAVVKAGKMPHAFASPPVAGEFVWDGDVSPGGIAATWKLGGDSTRGDVRVAGYVAAENNLTAGSTSDPTMVGLQGNLYLDAGERTELQVSSSVMDWSSLGSGSPGANQGNTDPTVDFTIWEAFVGMNRTGGTAGGQQAFAQFMNNVDDSTGEDTGFALGAKLGPSGTRGDTNYFLSYYDLDANAVFSPVAQDDTPIAGTGVGNGMSGFVGGVQHYLADHVTLKLWALTSDADDPSGNDPVRVRLDLDFGVR